MSAHDGQVRRASNDAYGYGKATAKTDASRAFGTNLTNRITQAAAASKPVAKVSQQNTTHDIPVSLPVLAPVQQAQAPEVVAPMLTRALLDDVEIPEVDIESNRDRRDPAQVSTYIGDIMGYFKNTEAKYMPPSNYLNGSGPNGRIISMTMRTTVINWIVNVHKKFKLKQETLFLAINVVDRFLATCPVSKDKLTLVAATSLLVASKFEDQWAPLVRDLVYVGSSSFTAAEVRGMENTILNALKFEISVPTVFPFLVRSTKAAKLDANSTKLASYIAEVALHNYSIIKYTPSMIAASSVALAGRMSKRGSWTSTCASVTGFTEAAMAPCMLEINDMLKALPAEVKAVRNKYTGSAMGNASTLRPVEL